MATLPVCCRLVLLALAAAHASAAMAPAGAVRTLAPAAAPEQGLSAASEAVTARGGLLNKATPLPVVAGERHRAAPLDAAAAAPPAASRRNAAPPQEAVPPQQPLPEGADDWEASYSWGLYYSKLAADASEAAAGSWAVDEGRSGAGVPHQMLLAEELLLAADRAPEAHRREKTAERALRLYYHAKWLAERNYGTAAEWRYREASRVAQSCRRNVLASHALSRLGYFLVHWRREDEAREAFLASEKLSVKANPLAPYMLGVLDRRAAGDAEALRAAEDRILSSSVQPSEDLEAERLSLIRDIGFWRTAEVSPRQCFAAKDAAHLMVCLSTHLFRVMYKATTK